MTKVGVSETSRWIPIRLVRNVLIRSSYASPRRIKDGESVMSIFS